MQTLFPHVYFPICNRTGIVGFHCNFGGWWSCNPGKWGMWCDESLLILLEQFWFWKSAALCSTAIYPERPTSPWNHIGRGIQIILITQTRQNIIDYLKIYWSLLNSHEKLCCYVKLSNGQFKVITYNYILTNRRKITQTKNRAEDTTLPDFVVQQFNGSERNESTGFIVEAIPKACSFGDWKQDSKTKH